MRRLTNPHASSEMSKRAKVFEDRVTPAIGMSSGLTMTAWPSSSPYRFSSGAPGIPADTLRMFEFVAEAGVSSPCNFTMKTSSRRQG